MQFTTLLLTALGVATATTAAIIEAREQTLYCNGQPYLASQYTCYNGNLLCPISNGVIYQPCGTACYDPANYGCSNGKLVPVGTCNGQTFDKNTYVCVSNHLCPVGYPNLCGTNPGACYKTSQYKCVNGQLVQV